MLPLPVQAGRIHQGTWVSEASCQAWGLVLFLILLLSHFPSLLLPPEPVPQPGFD